MATPELSTLVSLLTQANLANTFANAGPPLYTVFAPTNAAFGTLNANQLSWLTNARAANAAGLVNVLTYHAAGGAFGNLTTLTPGPITTLNNNLNLTVAGTGAAATINGLPYAASIACTNGNVFTLNTGVLVPPNAGIPTQDIPSIAVTVPTLSSLVAALNASNLLPALSVPNGPFTVFAPLNTAFSRLPAGLLTGATLSTALQYHVVPGRLYAAQVAASTTLTSLTGANLTISVVNGTVLVNGYSAVTTADAADAANGVVHFVDSVIMPSAISLVSVATANGLTTLLAAVTAAGLAPTFSNVATPNAFTLFAPTNAAFAAVGNNSMSWLLHPRNVAGLTSVLQYHAVAGARYSRSFVPGTQTLTSLDAGAAPQLAVNVAGPTVTVNGITVTSADNAAYNGVAHVINGVLVPSNSGLPPLDIVATAVAAPAQLSALVAALTGAGLVTALSNPNGPFTVFAPVNSAFARNSPGLLTGATLTTTLQYHVVPGRFYASDLSTMSTVTTLAGTVLRLTAPGGGLLVNGYATVTTADIDCANGVVHLVDFVIMPPAVTLAGVATAAGLSTLVTVASSVPAILAALTSVATPNALTL